MQSVTLTSILGVVVYNKEYTFNWQSKLTDHSIEQQQLFFINNRNQWMIKMTNRLICLMVVTGSFLATVHSAPRITRSDQLISSIVDNCWSGDAMNCIKEKVLDYMNNLAGYNEQTARSFSEEDYDGVVFERAARILSTNEFRVELPGTAVVTYRADKGLNLEVPEENG